MTKEFKIVDDKLIVTITTSNEIFIPDEEGNKTNVGVYDQTTIQKIDKDKKHLLEAYVKNEFDKATKQQEQLTKQYDPIKDIKDLDEKLVEGAVKSMSKGQKAFKDKLIGLSAHIDAMNKKETLKVQIDYIDKQILEIQSDLDGLKNL